MKSTSASKRADIKYFLSNHFTIDENKQKVCKGCVNSLKTLAYCRLLAHLSSCEQVSSQIKNEARSYIEEFSSKINDDVSNTKRSADQAIEEDTFEEERITKQSKKNSFSLISKLFFSTGMSFRIADTAEWRDLFDSFNLPTPCSQTLRTSLLESNYLHLKAQMKALINERVSVTIVTDGWSDIRGDHYVNYLICIPTMKPIYWKREYTGNNALSGEYIANGIENVMQEIGINRVSAIVTDNARNMTAAWAILKGKYPHLITNGCSCHVINLIIKDVFSNEQYNNVINQSKRLINAVNHHIKALANFREIRRQLRTKNEISCELELVQACATRWHSQIDSLHRLQINRPVLQHMVTTGCFAGDEDAEYIHDIIHDAQFWDNVEEIHSNCKHFKEMIKVLESDNIDISFVCNAFLTFFSQNLPSWIIDIVEKRWKFLRTWSMLCGYFLNPVYHAGKGLAEQELDIAMKATIAISAEETGRYIQFSADLDSEMGKDISETGILSWWSTKGRLKFPKLSVLARRLFAIVTSNSPSERAWSIIDFIHSKRRNRLTRERVDMLAFLYLNHSNPDIVLDINDEDDSNVDADASAITV